MPCPWFCYRNHLGSLVHTWSDCWGESDHSCMYISSELLSRSFVWLLLLLMRRRGLFSHVDFDHKWVHDLFTARDNIRKLSDFSKTNEAVAHTTHSSLKQAEHCCQNCETQAHVMIKWYSRTRELLRLSRQTLILVNSVFSGHALSNHLSAMDIKKSRIKKIVEMLENRINIFHFCCFQCVVMPLIKSDKLRFLHLYLLFITSFIYRAMLVNKTCVIFCSFWFYFVC